MVRMSAGAIYMRDPRATHGLVDSTALYYAAPARHRVGGGIGARRIGIRTSMAAPSPHQARIPNQPRVVEYRPTRSRGAVSRIRIVSLCRDAARGRVASHVGCDILDTEPSVARVWI